MLLFIVDKNVRANDCQNIWLSLQGDNLEPKPLPSYLDYFHWVSACVPACTSFSISICLPQAKALMI